MAGPGILNISDSLNWTGATIRGSGVINLASGSTSVWNENASVLSGRTLNNYGAVRTEPLTLGRCWRDSQQFRQLRSAGCANDQC